MTCNKDCIHYEACKFYIDKTKFKFPKEAKNCSDFKDKSKYIELPCKVGNMTIKCEDGEIVIIRKGADRK